MEQSYGAPTAVLMYYYNPICYDQMPLTKQQQEICLFWPIIRLTSSLEILNYTKNAKITLFQGTNYEETQKIIIILWKVEGYLQRELDGLKPALVRQQIIIYA